MEKTPTPRQMRREERRRRNAEQFENVGYSGVDPQACSKCCETTADICCGIKCKPENKPSQVVPVSPNMTRGGRKTRRKRRKKRRKSRKMRKKTKRRRKRRRKKSKKVRRK